MALELGTGYLVVLTPSSDGLLLSCKRPAVTDSAQTLRTALSWALHPVILDPAILPLPFASLAAGRQVLDAVSAVLLPIVVVIGGLAVLVTLLLVRRTAAASSQRRSKG